MRPPKTHDNTRVAAILDNYWTVGELCSAYSRADDIFAGVLAAATPGHTGTRTLSRGVLFHILQNCRALDVASINEATHGRYARRTLSAYAAHARIASRALERLFDSIQASRDQWDRGLWQPYKGRVENPVGAEEVCT